MISEEKEILLISVKPQFAVKIIDGTKTLELRKSRPLRAKKGSTIIIYVTSPIKEVWAVGSLGKVIKSNPRDIWKEYGGKTGISEIDFNTYYSHSIYGFGLELRDMKDISKSKITLEELKSMLPGFSAPQTFRYLKADNNILERLGITQ